MDNLVGYSQGTYRTVSWYEVKFERYGYASVAIEECGRQFRLVKKETLPPKGLTKEDVNNYIYEYWNIVDERKTKKR